MIEMWLKVFIKNYQDVTNPSVRKKYGILGGIFGIFSNLILFVSKLTVGFIFVNSSLIADGINNLSDCGSCVVNVLGFKLAAKPADKEHPFGHERIEYIASFIIACIIIFLGGQLLIDGVKGVINPSIEKLEFVPFIVLISVSSFSILLKLYQSYFNISLGKKIDSLSLQGTGVDSRNDVIATSVILIGLIISYFTSINLDGYLTIAVSLFVIYSGVRLALDTSNILLGEKPDRQLVDKFCNFIKAQNGVLGVHDLQIYSYGPNKIFASVHVEVDSKENIMKSHDMIDNIEKELFARFNVLTTIHMDPILVNDKKTEECKCIVMEVLKELNYKFRFHDFRIVSGPSHTNLIFDIVIPHQMKNDKDLIVDNIKQTINKKNPTLFAVIGVDDEYTDIMDEY